MMLAALKFSQNTGEHEHIQLSSDAECLDLILLGFVCLFCFQSLSDNIQSDFNYQIFIKSCFFYKLIWNDFSGYIFKFKQQGEEELQQATFYVVKKKNIRIYKIIGFCQKERIVNQKLINLMTCNGVGARDIRENNLRKKKKNQFK